MRNLSQGNTFLINAKGLIVLRLIMNMLKGTNCNSVLPLVGESGKEMARRLMRLVLAKEQETGNAFRPTLSRVIYEGRVLGMRDEEMMRRMVYMIVEYLDG